MMVRTTFYLWKSTVVGPWKNAFDKRSGVGKKMVVSSTSEFSQSGEAL